MASRATTRLSTAEQSALWHALVRTWTHFTGDQKIDLVAFRAFVADSAHDTDIAANE
jgi:hypothetical protein